MTEEEIQLLSKLVNGGNTKIGQIILDNHGTMNINNGETKPMGDNLASTDIDSSMVSQALAKCGDYIWGNSAYAVPFCVCRDVYGWEDNASLFERKLELEGVELPPGTINTAINRNPYIHGYTGNSGSTIHDPIGNICFRIIYFHHPGISTRFCSGHLKHTIICRTN